jgi:hypothetical protein
VFFFIANDANRYTIEPVVVCAQTSINTKYDNQYSSCSEPLTAPYTVKTANILSLNLLHEKSKERYVMAYEKLLKLRRINKTKSLSENVFLTNFNKLPTETKPSTLWFIYSMFKSMKNMKHNINVGTYLKLQDFSKRKSSGLKVKSKSFDLNLYKKFIDEAPHIQYLDKMQMR